MHFPSSSGPGLQRTVESGHHVKSIPILLLHTNNSRGFELCGVYWGQTCFCAAPLSFFSPPHPTSNSTTLQTSSDGCLCRFLPFREPNVRTTIHHMQSVNRWWETRELWYGYDVYNGWTTRRWKASWRHIPFGQPNIWRPSGNRDVVL